jgi:hypothetical protein
MAAVAGWQYPISQAFSGILRHVGDHRSFSCSPVQKGTAHPRLAQYAGVGVPERTRSTTGTDRTADRNRSHRRFFAFSSFLRRARALSGGQMASPTTRRTEELQEHHRRIIEERRIEIQRERRWIDEQYQRTADVQTQLDLITAASRRATPIL